MGTRALNLLMEGRWTNGVDTISVMKTVDGLMWGSHGGTLWWTWMGELVDAGVGYLLVNEDSRVVRWRRVR